MTPAGQLSSGAVRSARARGGGLVARPPTVPRVVVLDLNHMWFAFPRGAKTRGSCRRSTRRRSRRASREGHARVSRDHLASPIGTTRPPRTWTTRPTRARLPPANLTVVDATLREESPREDETDEAEDETGEEENEIGERMRDRRPPRTRTMRHPPSPSTSTLFFFSSSSSGSDRLSKNNELLLLATLLLLLLFSSATSHDDQRALSAIADDLGFAGDNFRKGVIVSVDDDCGYQPADS